MVQIKLERIGDDRDYAFDLGRAQADAVFPGLGNMVFGKRKFCKAWCAEVIGFHEQYKFARTFLKPNRDYTEANSMGSRGVYDYFNLENGKIYDISSPSSWKKVDRYYCRVENNQMRRITENEVEQWLNDRLGLTS
jgi:hypothetical protein